MNKKHYYRLHKLLGFGDQLRPITDIATHILTSKGRNQPETMSKKIAKRIISQYMKEVGIIASRNMAKVASGSIYVYIIQQDSKEKHIKIGVAEDVNKRVSSLQTASPYKLEVIAKITATDRNHALYMEKGFHERFKKYRLTGEWFTNDVLRYMSEIA